MQGIAVVELTAQKMIQDLKDNFCRFNNFPSVGSIKLNLNLDLERLFLYTPSKPYPYS